MPIRPENKDRYPSNWKEIRANILNRAGNKCEGCGLKNHSYIWRDIKCRDIFCEEDCAPEILKDFKETFTEHKRVKIVLTIAHLDHTPENNEPENLKAFCQACHNRYDARFRAANRKKNRAKRCNK